MTHFNLNNEDEEFLFLLMHLNKQGVNCTLRKTVTEEPWRRCVNVSVPVCRFQ